MKIIDNLNQINSITTKQNVMFIFFLMKWNISIPFVSMKYFLLCRCVLKWKRSPCHYTGPFALHMVATWGPSLPWLCYLTSFVHCRNSVPKNAQESSNPCLVDCKVLLSFSLSPFQSLIFGHLCNTLVEFYQWKSQEKADKFWNHLKFS
jgi:hypothetical protein